MWKAAKISSEGIINGSLSQNKFFRMKLLRSEISRTDLLNSIIVIVIIHMIDLKNVTKNHQILVISSEKETFASVTNIFDVSNSYNQIAYSTLGQRMACKSFSEIFFMSLTGHLQAIIALSKLSHAAIEHPLSSFFYQSFPDQILLLVHKSGKEFQHSKNFLVFFF